MSVDDETVKRLNEMLGQDAGKLLIEKLLNHVGQINEKGEAVWQALLEARLDNNDELAAKTLSIVSKDKQVAVAALIQACDTIAAMMVAGSDLPVDSTVDEFLVEWTARMDKKSLVMRRARQAASN